MRAYEFIIERTDRFGELKFGGWLIRYTKIPNKGVYQAVAYKNNDKNQKVFVSGSSEEEVIEKVKQGVRQQSAGKASGSMKTAFNFNKAFLPVVDGFPTAGRLRTDNGKVVLDIVDSDWWDPSDASFKDMGFVRMSDRRWSPQGGEMAVAFSPRMLDKFGIDIYGRYGLDELPREDDLYRSFAINLYGMGDPGERIEIPGPGFTVVASGGQ